MDFDEYDGTDTGLGAQDFLIAIAFLAAIAALLAALQRTGVIP